MLSKPTYICFVDFSKALFDSVRWPLLWLTLLVIRTPKHFDHHLRKLYKKGTASVRTYHILSNQIHRSTTEVHQGSILLPLLFNTYTELIMRISQHRFCRLRVCHCQVTLTSRLSIDFSLSFFVFSCLRNCVYFERHRVVGKRYFPDFYKK